MVLEDGPVRSKVVQVLFKLLFAHCPVVDSQRRRVRVPCRCPPKRSSRLGATLDGVNVHGPPAKLCLGLEVALDLCIGYAVVVCRHCTPGAGVICRADPRSKASPRDLLAEPAVCAEQVSPTRRRHHRTEPNVELREAPEEDNFALALSPGRLPLLGVLVADLDVPNHARLQMPRRQRPLDAKVAAGNVRRRGSVHLGRPWMIGRKPRGGEHSRHAGHATWRRRRRRHLSPTSCNGCIWTRSTRWSRVSARGGQAVKSAVRKRTG